MSLNMPYTSDVELGQATRETAPQHHGPPSDEIFGRRLADVGLPDVLYHPRTNPQESIINLGNLQRMMLHVLQRELVQEVRKIQETASVKGDQAERIRVALSNYASSIRDWELMVSYSAQASDNPSLDPFIITSSKILEETLMTESNLIPRQPGFSKQLQQAIDQGYAILPPILSATRKNHNRKSSLGAFWRRLYMAMFGGVALVAPMLLMVLYKHLLTSLLTTSIAVFIFAIAVATFSTGSPETVLASVAAYAAVLVVFVGTSS